MHRPLHSLCTLLIAASLGWLAGCQSQPTPQPQQVHPRAYPSAAPQAAGGTIVQPQAPPSSGNAFGSAQPYSPQTGQFRAPGGASPSAMPQDGSMQNAPAELQPGEAP